MCASRILFVLLSAKIRVHLCDSKNRRYPLKPLMIMKSGDENNKEVWR